MRIELFTLCDGAFNNGGRLTIVNTYDDVLARQFPWKAAIGVALKIFIPAEEKGAHTLSVEINNEKGDQVLHKLNANLDIPIDGQDGHVALASNIQGIVFPNAGLYYVIARIDEVELLHHKFSVIGM